MADVDEIYCGYSDYLQAVQIKPTTDNGTQEASHQPSSNSSSASPTSPTSPETPGLTFNLVIQNSTTWPLTLPQTHQQPALPTVLLPPKSESDADDDLENLQSFIKPKKLTRRGTGGSKKAAKHLSRKRHDPNSSPKGPQRSPGHPEASSAKGMHLRVVEMDDEYASEAEMSGLDDYYKADGGRGKRGSSKEKIGGICVSDRACAGSSGEEDSDSAVSYSKREVFDSDLESGVEDLGSARHAKKMRKFKSFAKDKFERMLLECIVNTEKIKPGYADMFIDPTTVAKLEHVTRMSLLRPKAFSKGVLSGNKVTGAVLYGPPGTGKSLLAKNLARNSGFNMILASTAELWQKCHGEDEKVIRALFSMGRKMHPCIIFIDEADALLGNRKAGEKRHIRAMLNQFLMEWDGLNNSKHSPFLLLATNRPFDLDPAVLRRAPVRIHLDIPTPKQRHGILSLLLRDETLGRDITIERLAKMTVRYTGSDLKNLCVTAATECVSEQREDSETRVLMMRHFQIAMVSIKATGLSRTVENEFKNFEKGKGQTSRQEED